MPIYFKITFWLFLTLPLDTYSQVYAPLPIVIKNVELEAKIENQYLIELEKISSLNKAQKKIVTGAYLSRK